MDSFFDLDTPLLTFKSDNGENTFTIRDSVEGVQIFGGIGSGKTSGSGKQLALKYLQAGYGGLVLTVKPDELSDWQAYCNQSGRGDDLIVVAPGQSNYFDFLEYESSGKSHLSFTDNIFQVLKTVIKAGEDRKSGKSDDQFWENAIDLYMTNVISLCLLAYNKTTIPLLYDIAQTAPKKTHVKAVEDTTPLTAYQLAIKEAKINIDKKVDEWHQQRQATLPEQLTKEEYFHLIYNEVSEYRTLKMLNLFFTEQLLSIGEKTRSIIDFSFNGFLFRLLRDPVYSLFCQHSSTFTPEDSLQGKIILINLPVKSYQKVGQDCQLLFKYIWQRAMERRNIKENERPVFLWSDEAQHFLHEYDAEYQATARSSRIATVYISQNLPNYYANMGGEQGQHKVKSFLGTLATKIFHANADIETNTYASSLIGEAYQKEESEATSSVDGKINVTTTISSKLKKMVRPEEFVGLKTGGPGNKFIVSCYMHTQGKKFNNGFNHQKISFTQ